MGEAAADHKSGTFLVRKDARVAQLVEQRIENPRVGGSSPPPGTTFPNETYVNPLFYRCFRSITAWVFFNE